MFSELITDLNIVQEEIFKIYESVNELYNKLGDDNKNLLNNWNKFIIKNLVISSWTVIDEFFVKKIFKVVFLKIVDRIMDYKKSLSILFIIFSKGIKLSISDDVNTKSNYTIKDFFIMIDEIIDGKEKNLNFLNSFTIDENKRNLTLNQIFSKFCKKIQESKIKVELTSQQAYEDKIIQIWKKLKEIRNDIAHKKNPILQFCVENVCNFKKYYMSSIVKLFTDIEKNITSIIEDQN